MKKLTPSYLIYAVLIITLAILSAINIFMPQGSFLPALSEQELPASKPVLAAVNACIMLVVYGGLGFLGLKLSHKIGFADLWDSKVTNRQRFLIPAIIGTGIGIFFILADAALSSFHTLGPIPHPPFPTSLVATAVAGIGEELIFRLFFISFWVWLISYVILKNKFQNQIFWIISIFSAAAFAIGHIPSVMMLYGLSNIGEIPIALMVEIFLLNGAVSIFAAYYFRKYGFLAPVGIHFWTDIVWHVIRGLF